MEIEENIDIRRFIDIIFSKKKILVFIIIVSMAIGYVYSYHLKQDIYKSSETILLAQNEKDDMQITQNDLNVNTNLITTYSNIARSYNVVETTINNLGIQIPISEVQNNIVVEEKKNTQIIEITIKNKNPEVAMKLTKELTKVFAEQVKNIYNLENINIIDEAEIESFPCNTNHVKDMSIFVIMGLGLIGVLVLIFYMFDDTIKQESDVVNYTGLQALGIIPMVENKKQNLELISHLNPKSYISEALKTVRTNILYTTSISKRKSILITSPKQEEGKTWISNNIAVSFAQAKKKTIIVDCNLRKKQDIEEFNIKNEKGLSSCINKITKDKIENVGIIGQYIQETQVPNLHILINGIIPPNPSELISSNNMKRLIATLKYMYDIVILDSTPCLEVSDSVALSSMVDNTILVVESKKTKINEVKRAKKSIEDVDGKIAGVIVNKKKFSKSGYYGKNYGYGYYYGHTSENNINIKEEQKGFTVEEIIEQAKANIKQEEKQNKNRTIKKEQNTKGQKAEVRVIKLIKRLFEKVLKIQKNVDLNYIEQENREKNNKQKQENINNNILSQLKDLRTEQEKQKNQNNDIIQQIAKIKEDRETKEKNISNKINQLREERKVKEGNILNQIDGLRKEQKKNKNDVLNKIKNLDDDNKNINSKILNYKKENKNSNITNDVENISTLISELIEKHNHIEENINYLKEQRKVVIGDINTLKDKNEYILDSITGLKTEKSNVLEIVRYLKEDQKYIVSDMDNLKTEKAQIFKAIEQLKIDNRKLLEQNEDTEEIKKLQITNKKMAIRVKKLTQTLQNLEDKIASLQELNDRMTNTEDNISQARLMQSMQISNINKQLEELRKAQESNPEEKIKMPIEEKEKKQENDNIISINTLRKKNKKAKKVFSIKDDIMYDDLENASEIILDLKKEAKIDTKIINN
ncbi:capsular exopolysaccharide family [Clostridium sp. CAG:575]|nr:capsular exopolysaccharide family [Clostridium sp. CAG:575]